MLIKTAVGGLDARPVASAYACSMRAWDTVVRAYESISIVKSGSVLDYPVHDTVAARDTAGTVCGVVEGVRGCE